MYENPSFDTGALRIRLKVAEDKVKAFESGERYVQLQNRYQSIIREQNQKIRRLEYELGKAHAQTVNIRNMWSEIYDDVYREANAGKFALHKEIARLNQRLLEVERQRDAALDKLRDKNHELYEVAGQLDEAEQKIAGLTASINKDYRNSSKSSSQSPNHKTIPNGREKSGRKPGGQKGHIHYERKKMEPTETVVIPAPSKYVNDPVFKATGRTISKQLVRLHVRVEVVEYTTPEFRNRVTGQRVHADFPEGLTNDVTYDGTVKAFAYLLNNECYVGIGKTRKFIKEVTGGKLNLSTGLICSLSRQFAERTQEERDEIFLRLLSTPVLHADFTFGRMNGKQAAVIICAADDTVLYQGRVKKGDEGVAGLEQKYDEIIRQAKAEYEYEPPGKYYKDGYNLYKRMEEEKERYMLFLHDPSVEPDNNLAERCARKFKRKAAQVMCVAKSPAVLAARILLNRLGHEL